MHKVSLQQYCITKDACIAPNNTHWLHPLKGDAFVCFSKLEKQFIGMYMYPHESSIVGAWTQLLLICW